MKHALKLPEIENPRVWRLLLLLEEGGLRVVAVSTVDDSSVIVCGIPFDPSAGDMLAALEEAVYAAPFLLSDFEKVDVLVSTSEYMVAPASLTAEALEAAAAYSAIVGEGESAHTDVVDGTDAVVLWSLRDDVARFLARTFRNPALHCRISPLVRYFSRKTQLGNTGKIYAHITAEPPVVDIVAFGHDGALRLAVTKPVTAAADSAYWILACAREAGLDPASDEILLCGDNAARHELMPLLRRYAGYVMPVIFPSAAFRSGRDALNAPFPLILIPLCE